MRSDDHELTAGVIVCLECGITERDGSPAINEIKSVDTTLTHRLLTARELRKYAIYISEESRLRRDGYRTRTYCNFHLYTVADALERNIQCRGSALDGVPPLI